jgi:hypothetical protein
MPVLQPRRYGVIASGWFTELKLRKTEGWWVVMDSVEPFTGRWCSFLILTASAGVRPQG